jgi:hypothetical protein
MHRREVHANFGEKTSIDQYEYIDIGGVIILKC